MNSQITYAKGTNSTTKRKASADATSDSKRLTSGTRFSNRLKVISCNINLHKSVHRQRHAVYVGGTMSTQEAPFKVAAAKFADKIEFVYTTHEDVRKSNWTEGEYIDKFTSAAGNQAHWFLAHPQQGLLTEKNWNSLVLRKAFVEKLYHHPGYPSNRQTGDNTLHQDKGATIKHLGSMAIPTLQVGFTRFNPLSLSFSVLINIGRFAAIHAAENEGRFTVKLPESTNSRDVIHCPDIVSAVFHIINWQNTQGENRNYAILQPTLANKCEEKLVFTESGFSHFAHNHFRPVPSRNFASDMELIAFGHGVMEKMKLDPNFLAGPVVRIDIMCRKDRFSNEWSGLVCNELESLEAMTCARIKSGGALKDFSFNQSVERFWENFIQMTYDHVRVQEQA